MPGYEVSRKLEKMGWHSSDTGEISFTDLEVPEENLLGRENEGFQLIMANFAWERLLMAIGAVGAMDWLIERSVALTTPSSLRSTPTAPTTTNAKARARRCKQCQRARRWYGLHGE